MSDPQEILREFDKLFFHKDNAVNWNSSPRVIKVGKREMTQEQYMKYRLNTLTTK